ncbi:MAG: hypothetical protein ACI4XH_09655 [Acutalibacteraceae bacterium]
MNRIIRKAAYILTCKHIDEKKIKPDKISLSGDDLTFFSLSTNLIISFYYQGVKRYFRECPKIMKFRDYFTYSAKRFFFIIVRSNISKDDFSQEIPISTSFSDETVKAFKKYIESTISNKSFLKTMADADIISESIGFNIWTNQKYGKEFFSSFGFDDIPESLKEITVSFLWYMRSAAMNYRNRNIVRGGKHSFFGAVRAVSSKTVAESLDLNHMIPDCRWCSLSVDGGEPLLGVISDAAPGERMADTFIDNPCKIQKEMLNLNALDVITLQVDHGPNNYNIYKNENNNYNICAFDNDNPYTFFPIPSVSLSLSGCSPLVNKKGIIDRPHLDADLALKIKNVDTKLLLKNLRPYLNFLQTASLVIRIKKLNRAIKKTQSVKSRFLIEDNEWNDTTLQSEIGSKSTLTYLMKALSK